jgi:hypothetical protein
LGQKPHSNQTGSGFRFIKPVVWPLGVETEALWTMVTVPFYYLEKEQNIVPKRPLRKAQTLKTSPQKSPFKGLQTGNSGHSGHSGNQ